MVRVWNSRGQVLAGAVVSDGIKPGVICIHQGAWPRLEPAEGGICKKGAVNVLTKDLPARSWGMVVQGTRRWAWVEKKYQGPELTLTAFGSACQLMIHVGVLVSSCQALSSMRKP